MGAAALELSGLVKRYPGVLALNRVDFACFPGEVHAVLGENGSGKSTLLGIASGTVVADEGRVSIMGQPLAAADPELARRLGLATVYQDDSLVRELTVADNLRLATGAPTQSAEHGIGRLLADYAPEVTPGTLVGQLTPSQRQFLEIAKALAARPKVLLLDEPTASLDLAAVQMLSATVRQLAAAGTAVVYVSHRLPEILDLAARVTILRDGEARGTYAVDGKLSEADLIALMIGRPIEAEYPDRAGPVTDATVMTVAGLSGSRFRDLSFRLRRGEILGFAGAEGNGQREALRALGGIEPSAGTIECKGRAVRRSSTRAALEAGILSLSADRAHESILPALSVRENMTLQVLEGFRAGGLIASARERARADAVATDLQIVARSLETPIATVSGGNQQKAVFARAVLCAADVVLIDEPTQGVDANARFDLYRAIRERADQGAAAIVKSSDAMELAGICDRVLVFSRGRIISELRGAAMTESGIVGAFLRSSQTADPSRPARQRGGGGERWWMRLLVLVLLLLGLGSYAAVGSEAFLTGLNLRHILLATAPLALATMAQLSVLVVRGFDLSVGSVMSLVVVLLSLLIGADAGGAAMAAGVAVCLVVGLAIGALNGALVRGAGINPVIATIATLSIIQGVALRLRPTPEGEINDDLLDLMRMHVGFVPLSCVALLALGVIGDSWLYGSRSGLRLRSVGFREQAAKRNGVHVETVHVRAYLLAALLASAAGFLLASEVGVGHPVIGSGYTLTSIAAAVLGGAALSGGRGSYLGALLGALFFTTSLNVITLQGLNTGAGIIVSGALTLLAVLLPSGWQPLARAWARLNGRR